MPVAARSEECVCDHSLTGIVGSNPTGVMFFFSCNCCVLLGKGVGLIIRPEESY